MASSSDEDFETPCKDRDSCRTYLLTYSQANLEKVPDCTSFTDIILNAFSQGTSTSQVEQWATCIENHADGGKHYHMIMKLSKPRRWKPVFEQIRRSESIVVNFSSKNIGYLAGYRYVCKNKAFESVMHSRDHPNLCDARSPIGKMGFQKFAKNAKLRRSQNPSVPHSSQPKRKRLGNSEIAKFIVENDLRKESQLLAFAKRRQADGLPDVYDFVLNKTPKALSDLMETTWKLHHAPVVANREKMDRMQIIMAQLDQPCISGCDGLWMESAWEVLSNNEINIYAFADAMRQCLKNGRKKFNNIMLTGPTNCGKSFLLNPLELIFKCFMNPAAGKYAWVGLDQCEVAYLNDFRWSEELIKWNDFLLLLEGQTVHLPRPKNQFATDLEIERENTIPFFSTSKSPVEFIGRYNSRDDRETEMMNSRWRIFKLTKQIMEIKDIPPCPHCFSVMVTRGMDG